MRKEEHQVIYRIIVAIDRILTSMYKEFLHAIVPPEKVHSLSYPEATQFLRGYSYVFSIHNALASIFAGFFVMAALTLLSMYASMPLIAYGIVGAVAWLVLLVFVWAASNVGFRY
jgi:hypothetical protein